MKIIYFRLEYICHQVVHMDDYYYEISYQVKHYEK